MTADGRYRRRIEADNMLLAGKDAHRDRLMAHTSGKISLLMRTFRHSNASWQQSWPHAPAMRP